MRLPPPFFCPLPCRVPLHDRTPSPLRRHRPHSASSSSPLASLRGLRERRIRRVTPPRRCRPGVTLPRQSHRLSPATVPHTCTQDSFPPERRIAKRYGAQRFARRRFAHSLGIRRFRVCALAMSDSPRRDQSVPLSARCFLGLYGAREPIASAQAADATCRPPIFCRRIAILPRPSRAPPLAGLPKPAAEPNPSAPERTCPTGGAGSRSKP